MNKLKYMTMSGIILCSGLLIYTLYPEKGNDTAAEQEKKISYRPKNGYGVDEAHVPKNNLLLTAEVVDAKNWIVKLTWKRVGGKYFYIPVHRLLKHDARIGEPVPFYPKFYGYGFHLFPGKYAESYLFTYMDRVPNYGDVYISFRTDDLGPSDFGMGINTVEFTEFLNDGDTFSCLFKFLRDKMDKDLGVKKGDRIPVDFNYKVGDKLKGHDPLNGQPYGGSFHKSLWRGELHSNVVYLVW